MVNVQLPLAFMIQEFIFLCFELNQWQSIMHSYFAVCDKEIGLCICLNECDDKYYYSYLW
jgi:hypothetical protein